MKFVQTPDVQLRNRTSTTSCVQNLFFFACKTCFCTWNHLSNWLKSGEFYTRIDMKLNRKEIQHNSWYEHQNGNTTHTKTTWHYSTHSLTMKIKWKWLPSWLFQPYHPTHCFEHTASNTLFIPYKTVLQCDFIPGKLFYTLINLENKPKTNARTQRKDFRNDNLLSLNHNLKQWISTRNYECKL